MLKEIGPPNEFFLRDPKLALKGLHDSDLVSLHKENKLQSRPESKWFTLEDRAVIRMEPCNDSVIVHAYLSTEHQYLGFLKQVEQQIFEYLRENTKYTKMIVPVPESCFHVIVAMKNLGFKYSGRITKKMTWRNKQVDLLYYTKEITW